MLTAVLQEKLPQLVQASGDVDRLVHVVERIEQVSRENIAKTETINATTLLNGVRECLSLLFEEALHFQMVCGWMRGELLSTTSKSEHSASGL